MWCLSDIFIKTPFHIGKKITVITNNNPRELNDKLVNKTTVF